MSQKDVERLKGGGRNIGKGKEKKREEDKRKGNSRLPCRAQTCGYVVKDTHRMPVETTENIDQ